MLYRPHLSALTYWSNTSAVPGIHVFKLPFRSKLHFVLTIGGLQACIFYRAFQLFKYVLPLFIFVIVVVSTSYVIS